MDVREAEVHRIPDQFSDRFLLLLHISRTSRNQCPAVRQVHAGQRHHGQGLFVLRCGVHTVVNERVESWHSSRFDTITSRAFAQLGDFVKMTEHLILDNGIWLAMKGVYPYEEIMSLPENVKVDAVHSVNVPNLDAQRHIVVMTHKKE